MRASGWRAALVAGLLVAMPAAPAGAARTKTFFAILSSAQETPPTTSNGIGAGLFTFDEGSKMLCYAVSYSRLDDNETGAHIHGPAAALSPDPAPILFTLVAGNPKNGCVGPIVSGKQKKQLKQGLFYVNVHSAKFLGGEIRGQLLPAGR